jgi:hypothetical protein
MRSVAEALEKASMSVWFRIRIDIVEAAASESFMKYPPKADGCDPVAMIHVAMVKPVEGSKTD